MESGTVSTKPLTKEEAKILLSFIESSKIINNKATNAATNKMKNEEWKRIADQFNAIVTSCHRTPQQLRLKWENLKKNSRKRNTLIRMNNIKTGGGGPDYIPPDEVLDRVAALLGSTGDGFTVCYGGDAEPEIEYPSIDINNVGGGTNPDSDMGSAIEATPLPNEFGVLEEVVVLSDKTNAGDCLVTTPKPMKVMCTPRASGFKRKQIKFDENRAARNQAMANYYNMKAKLLETNLENILLENKKLKLEIEKLQKEKD